jgi:hypothetical protein
MKVTETASQLFRFTPPAAHPPDSGGRIMNLIRENNTAAR